MAKGPMQAATVSVDLTEDSAVKSYSTKGFDNLLKELAKPANWGAQLELTEDKKAKDETKRWQAKRVISLIFPQLANAHEQGKNTYKYQADVGEAGAGSQDRLFLTVKSMDVESSEYDAKKDRVTAKVKIKGSLTLETKTHKGE